MLEALFGLCADGPVRIEVDRLLICLERSGLHHGSDRIALGFELHRVDQRDAQQIPRLCALGVQRQGLLQRLDSFLHAIRLIQNDSEVAPCQRAVSRVEVNIFLVRGSSLIDLAELGHVISKVVVVGGHVRFHRDGLLIGIGSLLPLVHALVSLAQA